MDCLNRRGVGGLNHNNKTRVHSVSVLFFFSHHPSPLFQSCFPQKRPSFCSHLLPPVPLFFHILFPLLLCNSAVTDWLSCTAQRWCNWSAFLVPDCSYWNKWARSHWNHPWVLFCGTRGNTNTHAHTLNRSPVMSCWIDLDALKHTACLDSSFATCPCFNPRHPYTQKLMRYFILLSVFSSLRTLGAQDSSWILNSFHYPFCHYKWEFWIS